MVSLYRCVQDAEKRFDENYGVLPKIEPATTGLLTCTLYRVASTISFASHVIMVCKVSVPTYEIVRHFIFIRTYVTNKCVDQSSGLPKDH